MKPPSPYPLPFPPSSPRKLCQLALTGILEEAEQQPVLLSQILLDDVNTGYQGVHERLVEKVRERPRTPSRASSLSPPLDWGGGLGMQGVPRLPPSRCYIGRRGFPPTAVAPLHETPRLHPARSSGPHHRPARARPPLSPPPPQVNGVKVRNMRHLVELIEGNGGGGDYLRVDLEEGKVVILKWDGEAGERGGEGGEGRGRGTCREKRWAAPALWEVVARKNMKRMECDGRLWRRPQAGGGMDLSPSRILPPNPFLPPTPSRNASDARAATPRILTRHRIAHQMSLDLREAQQPAAAAAAAAAAEQASGASL